MNDRYPDDEDLEKLKNWNISREGLEGLLILIEELWSLFGWGYKIKGKRVKYLELHTGGWSGNEEIIQALKYNYIFWSSYWQKSIRGGHYYFRIPLINWNWLRN